MDTEGSDRHQQPWAIRFSLTMHALNPGMRIGFKWLNHLAVLAAVSRIPEWCRG